MVNINLCQDFINP